jgi:hypothetical protein
MSLTFLSQERALAILARITKASAHLVAATEMVNHKDHRDSMIEASLALESAQRLLSFTIDTCK